MYFDILMKRILCLSDAYSWKGKGDTVLELKVFQLNIIEGYNEEINEFMGESLDYLYEVQKEYLSTLQEKERYAVKKE